MTVCWRIGALALVVGLALEPGGARAEPDWADPVAESAAAMRAGQYLADLRSCAWGRQPAFMVYGAVSADTIEDGLVRLLPSKVAKDGGVQRNARQGFILGSRVCLIPGINGAFSTQDGRDALWARFFMGAPRRQRRCVERYSIVKRA